MTDSLYTDAMEESGIMEIPQMMTEADLIERFIEMIALKRTHYFLDEASVDANLDEVTKFVSWIVQDMQEALHCPRGGPRSNPETRGKSYFQRREAVRAAVENSKPKDKAPN
jgi:hypothetical protein